MAPISPGRLARWLRAQRKGEPAPSRVPIALRTFAGHARFIDQLGRRLRVAHLTDLHVGRVTPRWIQEGAIALANAQAPDLFVLTGDFVCHSQMYLEQLEDLLRGLAAPAIGVLGNHDHWSGSREVTRVLERAGVQVLANANTVLSIAGEKLQIVGLDDAYTGHADRARALRGMRPDLPTIALSHIAEEADALWAAGVPMVFSGHTHAGQVTLARFHELLLGHVAGHRYLHGLYGDRWGQGVVYVGAGIGASVVPFRVGERGKREVALFELGARPGEREEHHLEQAPMRGRAPSERAKARRAARALRKRARLDQKSWPREPE